MNYTINQNEQFGSIEITFDGKPSEAVREALKALKFRWHGQRKLWYGYSTEEALQNAIDDAAGVKVIPVKSAGKSEPERSHNIKVGDLFYSSWGYEQTNVDFFQVVELVGKSSVRVKQVSPRMVSENGISGMSADRAYAIPEPGELLPACSSVFIEDNERGDIKRVRPTYDGTDNYFKVGKAGGYQTAAYRYNGQKLYESWYA